MSVVFLIGGTGNQFFSYSASKEGDTYSEIFLNKWVRKLLNWTDHEKIINYPNPNFIIHFFSVVVLLGDLLLWFAAKKTLFSAIDTRKIKTNPIIVELVRIGYFQHSPERRDVKFLAKQIVSCDSKYNLVIHIRGGDLLKIAGGGVYGILAENYYKKSILKIDELGAQIDNISIITDDREYANSFNLSTKGVKKPNIICCNLSDTLAIAVGADWFISSNSTLSYWIVKLKGGAGCVVPEPFQKVSDFSLPEKCMRVPAEFKN